jgi:hypothetical protein
MSEQLNIRVETTIINKEVDTNYLVKLPEYKTEIIVRGKYIDELIEKLTILNKSKNEK